MLYLLCIVCKTDSVCDSLVPTGQNGTCYRGGLTVFENYQMCNVTSKFLFVFLPFKQTLTYLNHRPKYS